MLSRLLDVCPEAKLEPEPLGQEFGCYCFEEMKPIQVDFIEEIETDANTGERRSQGNQTTTKRLANAAITEARLDMSRNRQEITTRQTHE